MLLQEPQRTTTTTTSTEQQPPDTSPPRQWWFAPIQRIGPLQSLYDFIVSAVSSQWYFEKNHHTNTTTTTTTTAQEDRYCRYKGILFLQNVGMRLGLPQLTIATASVFFHRFYMLESFQTHNYFEYGAGCLYLACKVEESNRRLKDFITAVAKKASKNEKMELSEDGKEYAKWKCSILRAEDKILRTIQCDTKVLHPYQPLILFLTMAKTKYDLDDPFVNTLGQICWAFVNDSLRTTACVHYPPHIIAAGAIKAGIGLITGSGKGRIEHENWWEIMLISEDQLDDVNDVARNIHETLKTPPIAPDRSRMINGQKILGTKSSHLPSSESPGWKGSPQSAVSLKITAPESQTPPSWVNHPPSSRNSPKTQPRTDSRSPRRSLPRSSSRSPNSNGAIRSSPRHIPSKARSPYARSSDISAGSSRSPG